MGLNLDTNFKGYFLVGHGGGTVACAVAVVTPARVSRPLFLSDVDAGAHSCDRARAGNCPCSCRDGWGIKQGRHESFVLENHDIRYTASSKARALRAPQWLPMKITDVETIPLRLAEVRPNGDGLQDVLILRVHTDEGITGIGEAHTSPLVLKAIIDAPISQLTGQGLRQLLLGKDPLRINELWDLMYEHTSTFGRRGAVIHAMSGIDIALWDILGKVTGRPLYQLLGGARRDRVRVYASDLTPEDKTRVVPRAKELIDQGYTGVKFGWGTLGQNVREDARWVNELRRGVGPKVDLMVDMGAAISFGIMATFLFTFLAFGAFLRVSGADRFFTDFAFAVAGNRRGGPAKVAIISSALMGMLSGSTVSNVATTGTMTIPMMIRMGFKPHEAGAIESTASLGGALMPPLMGAGVFIMAAFTGVPLVTILGYSILPAVLYFASIYFHVESKARKEGIKPIPLGSGQE